MSKKLIQIMAVAALSAAASLPAFAGDMNNALGGNISRSNSYNDDYDRGYRRGKHHGKHHHRH